MATEWEGKVAPTRFVCARSGRMMEPGETFYSALELHEGVFERRDISGQTWTPEDPQKFLSWWKRTAPAADPKRAAKTLDANLLKQLFRDLKDRQERPERCFCYVVALGLARLRAMHLVEVQRDEKVAHAPAYLMFEDRANGVVHRVRDPGMTAKEEEEVTAQLLKVLE
jgi:hypothetical protein